MAGLPSALIAKAETSQRNKRVVTEEDNAKTDSGDGAPHKEAKTEKKRFGKNMVIWIKHDSYNPVWENVELDADNQVKGEELRRLVGGYIEPAPFEHIFDGELPKQSNETRHIELYCNEEGRLMGLPLNQFAQEFGLRGASGLCGDVVVCVGTPDGETECFTEEDLKLLPKALVP